MSDSTKLDDTFRSQLVDHCLYFEAYGADKRPTFQNDLHDFFASYVITALWSSNDPETEQPLDDGYTASDIEDATFDRMYADCKSFWNEEKARIESDPVKAGADFWLTRNRHGAGFWDGDWTDGDELTKSAHAYGSFDLVVNEGKVCS